MSNDLFYFDGDEEDTKLNNNTPSKKPVKITEEEVYKELYERVNFKRKIKTSIFSQIDKDILNNISEHIMRKEMSYRVALDKLKKLYPEIEELKNKRHESLRYFLIKHKYVINEKALKTIHKSISNSEFAKNKRDRIISDVINEIFSNEEYINTLLSHPLFKEKVLSIIN